MGLNVQILNLLDLGWLHNITVPYFESMTTQSLLGGLLMDEVYVQILKVMILLISLLISEPCF